ncbi:MAG: hydantoinase/oxoprolinase family protein [Acidobacteriota bacterium]|nr:hydantoinase/oxoprolinase family protein [Acidobacteriota bacterium]
MIIGLDVGGTYTDAVLLDGGRVVMKNKAPTDDSRLLNSLINALDPLLENAGKENLERIVLSTTLITNLIATEGMDRAALVIIPGPGLQPDAFDYRVEDIFLLSGAVDYLGREIEPLNEKEIRTCAAEIGGRGIRDAAVVGKFSQRNNAHERRVAGILEEEVPGVRVVLGHRVTGRLNFPRRVYTSLLTLATRDKFRGFYSGILDLLEKKGITAPLYILKADGGTLAFELAAEKPVETILSGPAAGVLGALALHPPGTTSVVVDIGGTTTDLSLILSGKPLLASSGARIGGRLTHVRSFAAGSTAVGGDSALRIEDGALKIMPYREGPAFCLGGPCPTPTDAMRTANLTELGDGRKAAAAMEMMGRRLGLDARRTADLVLVETVKRIAAAIEKMFSAWEEEPLYRIWELRQERKARPQNLVGIGAASPGLLPLLGKETGCGALIPPDADVANAVGAALARVNLRLTFHFDTERDFYFIEENGVQGRSADVDSLADAEDFSLRKLKEEGARIGVPGGSEPEIVYSEMFNMVRGGRTAGRLIDVCVQFPAGIIGRREGGDS